MPISDQMKRIQARKLSARQQAAGAVQRDRTTPSITATVTGRDNTTGLWIATLPGGGTIPVESQTTANLLGQRVNLSRDITGNLAVVDAAPVPDDQAGLLRAIEKSEADLFQLAVHQVIDVDPNDTDGSGTTHPRRYDRDLLYSSQTELFYRWDVAAEEWVPIGGGGRILYGLGDPNSYGDLSDRIPWEANAIYYDITNARAFIASPATDRDGNPAADTDKFWMPTGAKTASAQEPLDMYYVGDFWQDEPVDATDESGGMLYRLNEDGDWDPQYICGDCEPDDGTPTMCFILKYTTTPGSPDFNWFKAYYDCDNPPPINSEFWNVDAGGS